MELQSWVLAHSILFYLMMPVSYCFVNGLLIVECVHSVGYGKRTGPEPREFSSKQFVLLLQFIDHFPLKNIICLGVFQFKLFEALANSGHVMVLEVTILLRIVSVFNYLLTVVVFSEQAFLV